MRLSTLLLAAVGMAPLAQGQEFFEDFDDGNAATRWAPFVFSAETGSFDGVVDFAVDYGALNSAVRAPLPPAPRSNGTTMGLGLQVNNIDDPVFEGEAVGVSPILGFALPNTYSVSADVFVYYDSGGGSSEHAVIGVNNDGMTVPFTFLPGGGGTHYHIPYNSGLVDPGFADDYYRVSNGVITELYGNAAGVPDPSTLNLFDDANEVFPEDVGYVDNRWFGLELINDNGTVTVFIEGVEIDTFATGDAPTAGEIIIGAADIFDSANNLNWIFWDNVRVGPPVAPCPCELDGADGVDVFDLLAYLGLWFTDAAGADIDGSPGVDVFDLLEFLSCWFPASAGGACP